MFDPKDKSFDKDSLQTPQYIFNWLNSSFKFDVDLAASDEHHYCDNYFTKEDSSLEADWCLEGDVGFCNPPYSNIKPWIEKALLEVAFGFTTVMFIPSFNGDLYYDKVVNDSSSIINILGRISFIRPDNGEEYKGNNRGSWIVVFSPFLNGPQYYVVKRDELKKKFNEQK